MSDRASLSYESIVLCDDIRLEADGKRTLVGVFTSTAIGVISFPFTIITAIYSAGTVSKAGSFRGGLRVTDSYGNELFFAQADETVRLSEGKVSQAMKISFALNSPTVLKFSLLDEIEEVASLFYGVIYNPAGKGPAL